MDFDEMEKVWNEIRERRAKEDEGLSPAEKTASRRKRLDNACRHLGLKVDPKTKKFIPS